MTTLIPFPEPSDEDVQRAVAKLETYVAGQGPAVPDVVPVVVPLGTKRVRELRAEVDEAHALLESQADAAPLLLDTERVRRSRKRAGEAARLHALAQDPAIRA
jgi:hypothetical protein